MEVTYTRGTTIYTIDGICYYVTSTQDTTVQKLEDGPEKEKFIRKVAYRSSAPGEEITSPEGDGRTAVLVESKSEEAPGEITGTLEPPDDDSLKEQSGYHP